MKLKNKTKIIIAGVLIIAVSGSAIGVYAYQSANAGNVEIVYKETTVEKGNLTVGVTESGSVSIGTITQDISDLEDVSTSNTAGETNTMSGVNDSTASSSSNTDLEVEEVYVTVGQEIKEGDPILKLTEESVAEYKEDLENAVKTASLALKTANLESKSSELNAQYTYNSNIANGNVAQSEYDATISSLQAAVDSAQAAVNSSAEKIADYQKKIEKGEDCSAALAEEQANYNSLVSKLQSVQNAQTTKTIEAQKTYDEAMLNYNNASSLYSIDTDGIEENVEDAQEALDDANEALSNFESIVGDGKIVSEYSGIITSVGYEAGDMLSASTDIVTLEDSAEVTMEVSVSQEDISAVNIGDGVEIALTAYEDEIFEGQVTSMDTSTSSGSSTVSYTVTVLFTGDTSKVYQDMTGNVTFVTSQVSDVLYVSNKAIINEGTVSYVDVKNDDGSIEKVQVITGFSDGVNVEISSGLTEGQTVLIESQVAAE